MNKDIEEDKITKKYPSQIKYEKNNPTITVRMKQYEKEKINEMAKKAGTNISVIIRMALLDLEKDFSAAKNEGHNNCWNQWVLWFFCEKCGKPLFVKPNSNAHRDIIEIMKGRLIHKECSEV